MIFLRRDRPSDRPARSCRPGSSVAALVILFAAMSPSMGAETYFKSLEIARLIAAPPGPASKAQQRDIAEVLAIQRRSLPTRRAKAILDDDERPERVVGAVMGRGFTRDGIPVTYALLSRVAHDAGILVSRAKERWGRPRPFVVDPRVELLVARAESPSYPSGHTFLAYEMATILGAMVPQKRRALFARAAEYGESRIVVGVHYPTDIVAGRIAGQAVAVGLLRSDPFKQELAKASSEMRARGLRALGSERRRHRRTWLE